jgi:restriction system protein
MTEPDPAKEIPDFQSLMLPLLRAAERGECRIRDVAESLADELGLSEAARAKRLSSGQTVFYNRVQWARTYLAKAGLIESTRRGYFRLTPRGEEVLASNPERIDTRFLSQYEEFRQFIDQGNNQNDRNSPAPSPLPTHPPDQTPDEIIRLEHRRIEDALATELLQRVRAASPEFFERLIIVLLLKMGFGGATTDAGRRLGRSGDNGVDGVIDQDALGLDRIYVQAKRYGANNPVGAEQIRNFAGSLDQHKAAKGVFVTTSSFTPQARQTVDRLSKHIVLIDGEQLARLMIRYNVGCREQETLVIKKIDEDFFE